MVTNTQPEPNCASAGGIEVGLEFFQAAEIAIDRGQHLAIGLAAVRPHDLPEHGVVGVTAEIIAHREFDIAFGTLRDCRARRSTALVGKLRIVLAKVLRLAT